MIDSGDHTRTAKTTFLESWQCVVDGLLEEMQIETGPEIQLTCSDT